ncbi:MAG: GNAT family N-acetyltransferase [Lachnospiraceae bacterium]|nr:GNAT family N-acetyltransferase [Lachnospiraceae bacterium]
MLLLTEGETLISFCTLAEQDDIRNPEFGPWIGFVHTFPQYRGNRHMGKLLEHAYEIAKDEGVKKIYISTGETGLYEKYGYTFYRIMKDIENQDSRVYTIDIV